MNFKKTINNICSRLVLFAVIFLIFLIVFFIYALPHQWLFSQDVLPNIFLPISVIQNQNLTFEQFFQDQANIPYSFRNIDHKIVSGYPIVPGILSIPVYFIAFILGVNLLLFSSLLSHLSAILITSLSVIFVYLILKRFCRKNSTVIFFSFVYAFATGVWSVASQSIWQHGPSLLFLSIALWMIVREEHNLIPWAGFFLGMAVWNRPVNFVIALLLTIYVFFQYRKYILKYILLAVIPMILMCLYSYFYYGSVLALGQGLNYFERFNSQFLQGFSGLLFSPGRGIMIYSPIFIFAFIYLIIILFSKNVKSILKYLSASVLILILIYSKWGEWWGGISYGYRLLTETSLILVILLAILWEQFIVRTKFLKIIFLIFLVASVYVQYLGVFVLPYHYKDTNQDTKYFWNWSKSDITVCTKFLWSDLHK